MQPAYVVSNIDITDPDRYGDYRRLVPPTLVKFDAGYLVRGGEFEVVEGALPYSRLVISRFPSWDHARNWNNSRDYNQVKAIRQAASRSDTFMTEGLSGDVQAAPGAGVLLAMETVHDDAAYREYQKAARVSIGKFGGQALAVNGRTERLEGSAPQPNNVILTFPDYATAKAWYDSPDYADAKALRQACADCILVIAEGL